MRKIEIWTCYIPGHCRKASKSPLRSIPVSVWLESGSFAAYVASVCINLQLQMQGFKIKTKKPQTFAMQCGRGERAEEFEVHVYLLTLYPTTYYLCDLESVIEPP